MDNIWLVAVFLIAAAALGFGIGWLLRGERSRGEGDSLADDLRTRLGRVEGERNRLQAELAVARDRRSTLEQPSEVAAEQRAEVERHDAPRGDLRASPAKASTSPSPAPASPPPVAPSTTVERVSGDAPAAPPPPLARPEGEADDLKRINGIGPGIEKTLHELGIFHFRQIAAFTPENMAWVDQHLRFKGRIEREDWIGQARRLVAES